jgi:hypothetical protein
MNNFPQKMICWKFVKSVFHNSGGLYSFQMKLLEDELRLESNKTGLTIAVFSPMLEMMTIH